MNSKSHRLHAGVSRRRLSRRQQLLWGNVRPLDVGANLVHLVRKEADLARALVHIPAQRRSVPGNCRAAASNQLSFLMPGLQPDLFDTASDHC